MVIEEHGLQKKWDCGQEVLIVAHYLEKFSKKLEENALKQIADMVGEISTNCTHGSRHLFMKKQINFSFFIYIHIKIA